MEVRFAIGRCVPKSGCLCALAPRGAPRLIAPFNDPNQSYSLPVWVVAVHWTRRAFGVIYGVNDRNDLDARSVAENPATLSFADAAEFLGVDSFTFHSLVQREEIPAALAANGEFVVTQKDLDKSVAKEPLC
jgi:hypothetical protein